MAHKIFISYTGQDQKLAEAIEKKLCDIYWGEIEFFLAHYDIQAGDQWKEKIRKSIKSCSAIISIITKNSIQKPWIFIEWSAFWIAGKKFYILMTDDVKVSDLINPMQELQLTFVTNVNSVKGLFNRLAEDAFYKRGVPFSKAEDFVVAVKTALIEQEKEYSEKTYSRYKENLDLLPINDREKETIATIFLQEKDFDTFKKISQRINNIHIKANLASCALDAGYPEVCYEICKDVWSAEILAQITIQYLENGFDDSRYVHSLVEEIITKDQGQLRNIAIYLAEQGKEDSAIFALLLDEFTNMAELRKVAEFFIANNRYSTDVFLEIVEKFSGRNQAELRKLGVLAVKENTFNAPFFELLMKILCSNNQREAVKVIKALSEQDSNLFGKYKGQITNPEALQYLEQ